MFKNKLVFSSNKGNLLSRATVEYWNSKISVQVGLKRIKIHGFRHNHATLLLKSGVDIKTVQYRLGHSKIETTLNIYAHVINDNQVQQAGENFAKYLKTGPNTDPQQSKSI